MMLIVCPVAHLAAICRERLPSHVVTMASPGQSETQGAVLPNVSRLALTFHDIAEPQPNPSASFQTRSAAGSQNDRWRSPESEPAAHLRDAEEARSVVPKPMPQPRCLIPPDRDAIDAILAFGHSWDGARPMLVSCFAGVSRSTAAAFMLACQRQPGAAEHDVAQALRQALPIATPNPLMVALADAALGRDGRMIAAVAAIGRGADYAPYRSFDLPALATA